MGGGYRNLESDPSVLGTAGAKIAFYARTTSQNAKWYVQLNNHTQSKSNEVPITVAPDGYWHKVEMDLATVFPDYFNSLASANAQSDVLVFSIVGQGVVKDDWLSVAGVHYELPHDVSNPTVKLTATASSITDNSAHINYNIDDTDTPGDVRYTLTLSGEGISKTITGLTPGNGTCNLTGLTPATAYTVSLAVEAPVGETIISDATTVTFTTTAPAAEPAVKLTATASDITASSVRINYAIAETNVQDAIRYTIGITGAGIDKSLSNMAPGAGTCDLTGLTAATAYTLTITAEATVKGVKISDTATVSFTTKSTSPVTPPPASEGKVWAGTVSGHGTGEHSESSLTLDYTLTATPEGKLIIRLKNTPEMPSFVDTKQVHIIRQSAGMDKWYNLVPDTEPNTWKCELPETFTDGEASFDRIEFYIAYPLGKFEFPWITDYVFGKSNMAAAPVYTAEVTYTFSAEYIEEYHMWVNSATIKPTLYIDGLEAMETQAAPFRLMLDDTAIGDGYSAISGYEPRPGTFTLTDGTTTVTATVINDPVLDGRSEIVKVKYYEDDPSKAQNPSRYYINADYFLQPSDNPRDLKWLMRRPDGSYMSRWQRIDPSRPDAPYYFCHYQPKVGENIDGQPSLFTDVTLPNYEVVYPFAVIGRSRAATELVYVRGSEEKRPTAGFNIWEVSEQPTSSSVSGVESVSADSDTDAVYFTLDGQQVDATSLAPGIYICRKGSKMTKVMVR